MSHQNLYTISPVAAAVSAALATPAAALAQEADDRDALEEIIVTATKREMDLQRIPASVQALPEAMLKEIGALNTHDYVRFLPTVNWITANAGSNQLIFRGIHTSTGAFTMTRSASMYLDEIPITSTSGDSPDIRMMDIERVEALSGPQGTLFGAAAQAGTLRVITNKPDPSQFEASADVEYRAGSTSDPSYSITGVFNLPLAEDKFAIRIAAQAAEDGGFVDNVPGHTPDTWYGETVADSAAASSCSLPFTAWGCNRLEWGSHRNDDVVEENWNSTEYNNFRISARWDISDAVATTLSYHYGEATSLGNNTYNPYVGDLQTIGFFKNTSESEWEMGSLVIEADLGFAQLVSATSFYENQRTFTTDNTMYLHYYMTRYYCADAGPGDPAAYYFWHNTASDRLIYNPRYCTLFPATNPSGAVDQLPDWVGLGEGPEWQDRFAQEIRLQHDGETFDWLAGLYYEESSDSWDAVWMASATLPFQESMSYASLVDCVNPATTTFRWGCNGSNGPNRADPNQVAAALQTADHLWHSSDRTDWERKAVFGEVTWHATDRLNVTIGGRWFENTNDKFYTKIIGGHTNPSNNRQIGGFTQPLWVGQDTVQSATLDEFVPKISVSYNLSDDKMLYGLYSEGFRVGGINRTARGARWDRTLWGQTWEPDKLRNYELGLRSRFADNTLQLNLTYFYMDWVDFQHEVVDPSVGECVVPAEEPTCRPAPGTTRDQQTQDDFNVSPTGSAALPWLSIVGNVGESHATGITAEVDWVPAENWHIGANANWLEREIDSTTAPPRAGIVPGMELPNTPDFQGAVWATYRWPVRIAGGAEMFIRGQYSYMGSTLSKLVPDGMSSPNPQFVNPAYSVADLRLGLVSGDGDWQLDLFVNNVTDERAQINNWNGTGEWQWGRTGEYLHSHNVVTIRPREYGLRFFARWGE